MKHIAAREDILRCNPQAEVQSEGDNGLRAHDFKHHTKRPLKTSSVIKLCLVATKEVRYVGAARY